MPRLITGVALRSNTTTWIGESSFTKLNTDSSNYVGQLRRPPPSTWNLFPFRRFLSEFPEIVADNPGVIDDKGASQYLSGRKRST